MRVMPAGTAEPLRKVMGRKRATETVDDHIKSIREFLYEEGPQTRDAITEHFAGKLTAYRVQDIMQQASASGDIEQITYQGRKYWAINEETVDDDTRQVSKNDAPTMVARTAER